MGGTALGVQADRMDMYTYTELKNELLNYFSYESYMKVIPTYENKKSFGDMDIIYRNDIIYPNDIIKNLNEFPDDYITLLDYKKNGNVLSVLLNFDDNHNMGLYQVDFIGHNEEDYDFAYNYYSNGDKGNLIGRLARSVGLKFGHNGLFYIQYDKENPLHVLKEHLVTNDYQEALYILGFGSQGEPVFEEEEHIFEWITKSKLFNKEAFLFKKPNKDVKRGQKRGAYLRFLEYIDNPNFKQHSVDKESFLKDIFKIYDLEEDIYKVYHQREFDKKLKEVYNGQVVMDITDLEGKELGEFMKSFVEYVGSKQKILDLAKQGRLASKIYEFYLM